MARIHMIESHKDSDIAHRLADGLSKSGHKLSLDQKYVIPGYEWQRELRQALLAADGLIAVLSENSVDSDGKVSSQWIAADIGAARAMGKFLIPVIIGDDFRIPALVSDIYAVLLGSRSEQELERGVREIDKALRTHIDRREVSYKEYVESGREQIAFFSRLNPVKRLYVLLMELRTPLLLWTAFAFGLALPRFLLWSFAFAEGVSPHINGENVFSYVMLALVSIAFIASLYVMLFIRKPSRQSIENAKFFAGFATGIVTHFLNPVLTTP